MKKFTILLCLLAILPLTACKKDKDPSNTNGPVEVVPGIGSTFIAMVEELGEVSLDSKNELNIVKQFYLHLNDEIKAMEKIKASAAILEAKIAQFELLYQAEMDQRRDASIIANFNSLIDNMPALEYLTLDDYLQIETATKTYEAISVSGKITVKDNYDKLAKINERYNYLLSLDSASYDKIYFIAKVNLQYTTFDEIQLADEVKISVLATLYAGLASSVKNETEVTSAYNMLKKMQDKLNILLAEQKIIDGFLDKVYELPGFDELRYQNQTQLAQINNCFTIYETLSETQKANKAVRDAYERLNSINQTFINLQEPYDINLCSHLNFYNNPNPIQTPVEAIKARYGYTDANLKDNLIIYLNFYIEGEAIAASPFYSMDITEKKTITAVEVFAIIKELSGREGYEKVYSGQHYCFTFKIESLNDTYGTSYYSEFFSRIVITF